MKVTNMIAIRMNFSKILGKTEGPNQQYNPPKRVVKMSDKESVEAYKTIIQTRLEKQQELLHQAKEIGRTGNKQQRNLLQQQVNKVIKQLIKEMMTAELIVDQQRNTFCSKTIEVAETKDTYGAIPLEGQREL